MVADKKDFSEDMELNLENIEEEAPQLEMQAKPRDLKEQHKAAKKAERGPLKNQTYTIPETVIEDLRQHVLTKKIAKVKISASQVVVEGIKMYLKKYG